MTKRILQVGNVYNDNYSSLKVGDNHSETVVGNYNNSIDDNDSFLVGNKHDHSTTLVRKDRQTVVGDDYNCAYDNHPETMVVDFHYNSVTVVSDSSIFLAFEIHSILDYFPAQGGKHQQLPLPGGSLPLNDQEDITGREISPVVLLPFVVFRFLVVHVEAAECSILSLMGNHIRRMMTDVLCTHVFIYHLANRDCRNAAALTKPLDSVIQSGCSCRYLRGENDDRGCAQFFLTLCKRY
ncbi:hypothetical protein PRIPAC_75401 [Pristionchus pacificus]|uniref:Uncharacterized protein n=1 Tax=Pristionchus pacificus TaxID=54126 RepID=A0A2A6D0G6_PRIPA|nr:hypothetical protein PRIPAC_75401 [Pristionchus pacificus]|eukprot:PDM83895.1 hypothetical protein PRIPAC_30382 [Pristionchus pacificus]